MLKTYNYNNRFFVSLLRNIEMEGAFLITRDSLFRIKEEEICLYIY